MKHEVSIITLKEAVTLPGKSGVAGHITVSKYTNKKIYMSYVDGEQVVLVSWGDASAFIPISNIKSMVLVGETEGDHVEAT